MTMSDCIEDCTECHRVCIETKIHCLAQGGSHAERDHIRLLWDCADACRFAADLMSRGSPFHELACGLCEQTCSECAESCEAYPEDAQMARCAEICRRCAASCEAMSAR